MFHLIVLALTTEYSSVSKKLCGRLPRGNWVESLICKLAFEMFDNSHCYLNNFVNYQLIVFFVVYLRCGCNTEGLQPFKVWACHF